MLIFTTFSMNCAGRSSVLAVDDFLFLKDDCRVSAYLILGLIV